MAASGNRAVALILEHIERKGFYILPYKYFTAEEKRIPIKVTFWKSPASDWSNPKFGINVRSRGVVEHEMFNISCSAAGLVLTEAFIKEQIERTKRILARPLRPMCGTLGPNKSEMLNAFGMDKKALGIEECCVCYKETTIQNHSCAHFVCLECFVKIDRCPICRNEELGCECCGENEFESENEDENDDEFASV